MIEMELSKIIIDEKRTDQIIVLKEKKGKRMLPLIIGFMEASAIKMKLAGVNPVRPLTHDLLKATIENLDATLERVVIDKLVNNTFHAKLVLKTKLDGERVVDARPSDSIALALRSRAAIFVEEEVLRQAETFPGQ